MTKPIIRDVRPEKIQIRLRICAVWSESSLIVRAFYSLPALQRGINKNPCHTGWMYRLISSLVHHILFARGRGVGRGGGVTSYIWHSTDVRAEWPPFSALPGIWMAPFFQKKYMNDPIFLNSYVKCPIFLTAWYNVYASSICTYFSPRDFSRLLVLLVFNELTVIFVEQPAINGNKNQRAVYE